MLACNLYSFLQHHLFITWVQYTHWYFIAVWTHHCTSHHHILKSGCLVSYHPCAIGDRTSSYYHQFHLASLFPVGTTFFLLGSVQWLQLLSSMEGLLKIGIWEGHVSNCRPQSITQLLASNPIAPTTMSSVPMQVTINGLPFNKTSHPHLDNGTPPIHTSFFPEYCSRTSALSLFTSCVQTSLRIRHRAAPVHVNNEFNIDHDSLYATCNLYPASY